MFQESRVHIPPLPSDVCTECAVDWSDVGYATWYYQREDGEWEAGYTRFSDFYKRIDEPDPSGYAISRRYGPYGQLAADGRPADLQTVSVNGKKIGLLWKAGPGQYVAFRFCDGEEGPDSALAEVGRYTATRFAERALVYAVTGYKMPVRNANGVRQAEYGGW